MLTYRSDGRGATVVLLHAFPFYSAFWEQEVQRLSRYARVITPDLPGFGFSPRMQHPSLSEMAQDVARLLDTLEVREPVVLGGLSMGGYTAFEFFRQFPDRVSALMFFSTKPGADSGEAKAGRMKTIMDIQAAGLESFAEKITAKLLGKHSSESNRKLVSEVIHMITSNKPEGVMDALKAMADRRDSTDVLASIQCPCLIAAGEEDEVIPVSEAKTMHEKIAGSELHIIPKAGHLVNLESPEVFGEILVNFLKTKAMGLVEKGYGF